MGDSLFTHTSPYSLLHRTYFQEEVTTTTFLAVILSLKLERKEFISLGDLMQFSSHSATKLEGISPNLEKVCIFKWKMSTSAPNPFL